MGKRELVALLNLSSWCLVMVERLFLAVPWGCLRFVIVVFPDHTHLLFLRLTTIGIINNIISHLAFRTRQIKHMLINVNSHKETGKCLKNDIKSDKSVNRGQRVLKPPL